MLGLSDIARIFEEIEMLLVRSLKRNLSRHKKEEEQEGFNWSAWQAEKLREIDRFRQENVQTVADFADQIDQETRQVMQEQFDEGVNGAEVPPAKTVEDAPAQVTPQPQFFGVDDTKVNKLIDDVTHLEKNVETAALRTMDDVYRQVVNKAQIAMSTGAMTLQQAIDSAVSDFLARGIDCIVYRDGRRVNIADYVRMALRTTATRAGLQGKSAKYKAMGYDTVLVSNYGMCSPTCAPWQGRIYIEDTFSMWDGEVQEYPDGTLWGKSNYCGKWFPLLSSAIEHGLFHPNCRHSINFWKDGDPIPESIDNTDSERRYKLEQKQRALEREVRRAKRKVEGFSDPENIRKAKAELKAAQKKLRDFIDQTNAAEGKVILKRDKNKEKIYGAPSPPVQSAPASPVDVPDTPKVTPAEVTLDAPQAPPDAYRDTPVPERETRLMESSPGSGDDTITVPMPDDKSQSYRPVILDESDEVTTKRDYEVKAHKAENTQNAIYVSENVDIKPKKLHQIDRHISEAIDKMGISDLSNFPKALVVSREDIATTDVATYRAIENILLICEDLAVYKPQDMPSVMNQLACGENDLSSYIHELYHWIDAEEFRRKIGAVTEKNYKSVYMNYVNNKARIALDKLSAKGYNILVSEYAKQSAATQLFSEIFTEYRTFSLLGGE